MSFILTGEAACKCLKLNYLLISKNRLLSICSFCMPRIMKSNKRLPLDKFIDREKRRKLKKRISREITLLNADLKKLLRETREEAGFSQAQVARAFGREQSFMTRLETGSRCPSFVEVERLAAIYGKRLDEFRTQPQPGPLIRYRIPTHQ
jgi:ribosome-binding protein aMBF1 (putative translation factor)